MSTPPFKLAAAATFRASMPGPASFPELGQVGDGADDPADDETVGSGRVRLTQMSGHLHCSVLGTCLSTAELRKVMTRFVDVKDVDDLGIHHDAVSHAAVPGPIAKSLQRALDHRHAGAIQRFAKARDVGSLLTLWKESLAQGEIPGAYWAVLTHRDATPEVRQRVFGDVHMLSHLVGAANRADIRRLVALEAENADLRERVDAQGARMQALQDERDAKGRELESARIALGEERARVQQLTLVRDDDAASATASSALLAMSQSVALQAERRERAELASSAAAAEIARLRDELDHARAHSAELAHEVSAMEAQVDDEAGGTSKLGLSLERHLRGFKVLYVGGRPSTTPAIRRLVVRHGGEFQSHDGGLEDRKGLLPAAVAWADIVAFPVDCVDHDSVANLKRICSRQGLPYVPLRSAGIASFAWGLARVGSSRESDDASTAPICRKHC